MRFAFTLVELLVVVTIIVTLLSLLAHAMDLAIYQAELAACSGNLKAAGTAGIQYAMNHKRRYPTRGQYRFEANQLVNEVVPTLTPEAFNLRDALAPYVGPDAWVDPLCGKIDADQGSNDPDCVIFSNYHVYYGWGITGFNTLSRYGAPFSWRDPDDPANRLRKYRVLVADVDRGSKGSGTGYGGTGATAPSNYSHNSHQDSGGLLSFFRVQNKDDFVPVSGTVGTRKVTCSWWQGANRGKRTVDNNYAFDDGSVIRFTNVIWRDPRMSLTVDTNYQQYVEDGRSTQLPEAP